MEVFVGGASAPTLIVPRLRNGTSGGESGFWARVNDKPLEWAAAISNLEVRPSSAAVSLTAAPNAPVQFVWNWQVSDPLPAPGAILSLPSSLTKWTAARCEETGLVNINRLFPVQKQRSVVFARHTLRRTQPAACLPGSATAMT